MSPAKHSYGSVTDGRTDRQTDDGQSDPYVSLCFAGDTKIATTDIQFIPVNGSRNEGSHILFFWQRTPKDTEHKTKDKTFVCKISVVQTYTFP